MAARLHSKTLSAAALAAAIAPTLFGSSMADRRAMDLGSGKMAMVVQHRHLQHVALAPAVAEESRARRSPNRRNGTERDVSEPRWPGQNGTLALEVERLNRTILDVPNETAMEEMVEREIERMIDSKQTVGNKTLLVMRDSSAVHQVWRKVDQMVRASRLKAAMRLCAIGRAPGGARALLPAVPGVALALERDADKRVRTRALTVLGLAGPELVERKATVVMQVLQAAREDKEAAKEVRVAALEALPQLLRHEDAAQAVPVILQAATEDTEGKVRAAGVDALARLVGPLAIEQAADALLVAAANDTEPLVREAALNHLPMLGPRSAERSVAVALRAVADEKDKEVRQVALKVLPMLGGIGAAEQTMINLSRTLTDRPDCSNCWSKERAVRIHKTFVTLTRLSDLFWRLEPAALKPLVPTLVVVLRESLPYLSLSMISGNAHVPAKEVAVMVGRALAKVASAAGTDVLNLLNKAEHEPDVDDTYLS
ncbi:unnamed protein product [Prorocentrum cordatum]|uniref:Uncharacterized protein n=1 Tax=Prorocentrum cordatum TaxID=2364126 RepID=A0ABN9PG03_9DINO|nr:unnamed protein product [Polarella glacialis]